MDHLHTLLIVVLTPFFSLPVIHYCSMWRSIGRHKSKPAPLDLDAPIRGRAIPARASRSRREDPRSRRFVQISQLSLRRKRKRKRQHERGKPPAVHAETSFVQRRDASIFVRNGLHVDARRRKEGRALACRESVYWGLQLELESWRR